jgi:hypothetical protein
MRRAAALVSAARTRPAACVLPPDVEDASLEVAVLPPQAERLTQPQAGKQRRAGKCRLI